MHHMGGNVTFDADVSLLVRLLGRTHLSLLPFIGHCFYAVAGPTPDDDRLRNKTATTYSSTVLANTTAPTNLTAVYNLTVRALSL